MRTIARYVLLRDATVCCVYRDLAYVVIIMTTDTNSGMRERNASVEQY